MSRSNKSSQPTGGDVIRMTLKCCSLFYDAFAAPSKLAKVHGESNGCEASSSRRAAPHSQRNSIDHANGQRNNGPPVFREQLSIYVQNEIVFQLRTALGIAANDSNRELRRGFGLDVEIKIESYGRSVESRPQIGGSSRQA